MPAATTSPDSGSASSSLGIRRGCRQLRTTAPTAAPSLQNAASLIGSSLPMLWKSVSVKWKLWAEKMAKIHKPEWEKAGIFDAVMNSVYQIERDDELVFGLAEKWCCKTNSFVFPWGEATLTLEDMAVYGFSVSEVKS
ncbi:hypothetical protein LINPERHAP1_LOCUS36328 [Linum perenne]